MKYLMPDSWLAVRWRSEAQVVRRRHHDRSGRRDEEHRVHLGGVAPAAVQFVARDQGDEHRCSTDRDRQELGEVVEAQRSPGQQIGAVVVDRAPLEVGEHTRQHRGRRGRQAVQTARPLGSQRADQQQEQRAADEGDQWAEMPPLDLGTGEDVLSDHLSVRPLRRPRRRGRRR
jgi:hypothetical protein